MAALRARCRLADGSGGNPGALRIVGSGGPGHRVFDAPGSDRHAGGVLRVFPSRPDVGLSFRAPRRGGFVVGEYLLWRASELAVVLAGGCPGAREEDPGELCWDGVWLYGAIRGGGAFGGAVAV